MRCKHVPFISRRNTNHRRRTPHHGSLGLQLERLEMRACPASIVATDSTFDPEMFGDKIGELLDFNHVGYTFAVNHQGDEVITRTGGLYGENGGLARTKGESDGVEVAFETDTRTEIASVSKIITTAAVLHAMDARSNDLDAALNAPISAYLPSHWDIGLRVDQITIRHLLTHTSGLYEGGDGDPPNDIGVNFEIFRRNNFSNLQELIATGVSAIPTTTLPNGMTAWPRSYSNINFTLLAKMLLYMRQDLARNQLDNISQVNSGAGFFGQKYMEYVNDHILEPAGIVGATMQVSGDPPAKGYFYIGAEEGPGMDQGNYVSRGGAFGWKLTAPELAKFLRALRYGDILSNEARRLMFDENNREFILGWRPADLRNSDPIQLPPPTDAFGSYYTHLGRAGGESGGFRARIDILPANVEFALVVNDDNEVDDDNLPIGNSFRSSFTELVIEGDANNNTFVVDVNSDNEHLIDIFVDGNLFLSYEIDVLQKLELRGLRGKDTFHIKSLPEHIELVLTGGRGGDTFRIGQGGNVFSDVEGDLAVIGDQGNDTLKLFDDNGFNADLSFTSAPGGNTIGDTRVRATSYSESNIFQYASIEEVEVRTNDFKNSISLNAIGGDTTMFKLYCGGDDDSIGLINIQDQVNVEIHGEDGKDRFAVYEVAEQASVQVFGDEAGAPGYSDHMLVGNGNLNTIRGNVEFNGQGGLDSADIVDKIATSGRTFSVFEGRIFGTSFGTFRHANVENINLTAGNHNDSIHVEELARGVELELSGSGGNDEFRIAASSHDVSQVQGNVVVHGGDLANEPLTQDGGPPVDDDRLFVFDSENDSTGDYTFDNVFGLATGQLGRTDSSGTNRIPFAVTYDQIEETTLVADRFDNQIDILAMPRANALTVRANDGGDVINVEQSPAEGSVTIQGEEGGDHINVARTTGNLDSLQSTVIVVGGGSVLDRLHIFDHASGNVSTYSLTNVEFSRSGAGDVRFSQMEQLQLALSESDNTINVSATKKETAVLVFGNNGNDSMNAANLRSSLVFDGGNGVDHARFVGTNADDHAVVQGNEITMGDGSLSVFSAQHSFDGRVGNDFVLLRGVSAVDELFHIEPMPEPYAGRIDVTGQTTLRYHSLESVEVEGNDTDNDTLQLVGRSSPTARLGGIHSDIFNIHLSAAGSADDPVIELWGTTTEQQLTVRDFRSVGQPMIDGRLGENQFRVSVDPQPSSTSRQIHLDGTAGPAGNGTLEVVYDDTGASLEWNEENDTDGEIDIQYDSFEFGVDYLNMTTTNVADEHSLVTITAGANADDGSPDTFAIGQTAGTTFVTVNGVEIFSQPTLTVPEITIQGSDDDDTLIVSFADGDPVPNGLAYHGAGQLSEDTLILFGAGDQSGVYEPDPKTFGNGTVTVGTSEIVFTGLEPVIIHAMKSAMFVSPGANDNIVIDSPAPGQNRISGTSDSVPFENLVFYDVGEIIIDVDRNDRAGSDDTIIFESDLVASNLEKLLLLASKDSVNAAAVTSFAFGLEDGEWVFLEREGIVGDLNDDRAIDIVDIELICGALASDNSTYDLNENGVADHDDFHYLLRDVLGTDLGDSNLDGQFNPTDLVQIFQQGEYEDDFPGNSTWSEGDWSCDGEFDTFDLVLAFAQGTYSANAIAAAVNYLFTIDTASGELREGIARDIRWAMMPISFKNTLSHNH